MNVIRDSMKEIRASEELKQNTMEYLREQKRRTRLKRIRWYAFAAACISLLLTGGGYTVYIRPVSYISIDVNPSVELGINRFGRVVEADAYNQDGRNILDKVPLKNVPYLKAIGRLLGDESDSGYLTEDSRVFITIISDRWETMLEEIRGDEMSEKYGAQTYTSNLASREEAHQYEMSFGKYRACQELSQFDESVTMEECHEMSMGEIEDKIETCKGHGHEESDGSYEDFENGGSDENYEDSGNDEHDSDNGSNGSHGGHHDHGH